MKKLVSIMSLLEDPSEVTPGSQLIIASKRGCVFTINRFNNHQKEKS